MGWVCDVAGAEISASEQIGSLAHSYALGVRTAGHSGSTGGLTLAGCWRSRLGNRCSKEIEDGSAEGQSSCGMAGHGGNGGPERPSLMGKCSKDE